MEKKNIANLNELEFVIFCIENIFVENILCGSIFEEK